MKPFLSGNEIEFVSALNADNGPRLAQLLACRPRLSETMRIRHSTLGWVLPTWAAVEKGSARVLEVLLKAGAPDRRQRVVNRTAFQEAARRHDAACVAAFETHRKAGPLTRSGKLPHSALSFALASVTDEVPPFVDRWLDDLAAQGRPVDPVVGGQILLSALSGPPSLLPRLIAAGIDPAAPPSANGPNVLDELAQVLSAHRLNAKAVGMLETALAIAPSGDASSTRELEWLKGWAMALGAAGAPLPTVGGMEFYANELAQVRAWALSGSLGAETPHPRPSPRPRL